MLGPARVIRRIVGPLAWASALRRPRPAAPVPGWAIGDCHIHSDVSDGLVPLERQAEWAAANRHGWIAVADHADGVKAAPTDYFIRCADASDRFGLAVLPAIEVTALASHGDEVVAGDVVFFGLTCAASVPSNQTLPPHTLMQWTGAHEAAMLRVVAHPCAGTKKWRHWLPQDVEAMELVTGTGHVTDEVVDRWFLLGRERLALGLRWPVGLGGSDGHAPWQTPGLLGATWLQTHAHEPREHYLESLRHGRAVVCTHGDFGCIIAAGAGPGEATHGRASLGCRVHVMAARGSIAGSLTVYDENQRIRAFMESPNHGDELEIATGGAKVLIAHLVFVHGHGGRRSEVWANPVYLSPEHEA